MSLLRLPEHFFENINTSLYPLLEPAQFTMSNKSLMTIYQPYGDRIIAYEADPLLRQKHIGNYLSQLCEGSENEPKRDPREYGRDEPDPMPAGTQKSDKRQ